MEKKTRKNTEIFREKSAKKTETFREKIAKKNEIFWSRNLPIPFAFCKETSPDTLEKKPEKNEHFPRKSSKKKSSNLRARSAQITRVFNATPTVQYSEILTFYYFYSLQTWKFTAHRDLGHNRTVPLIRDA